MSNVEDISPDPGEVAGFTNFSVSNGLAGGRTVHRRRRRHVPDRGINGTVTAHKNGFSYPIDTASYQKLSVRLSDSGLGREPAGLLVPQIRTVRSPPEQFGVKILPPTEAGLQHSA